MNSTNATFYPLTYWFAKFGFPYKLDLLNFYTITPLSLISLCLNVFAYRILIKAPFLNSEFFGFMKYYVLYGAFFSLVLTTSFTSFTRNIFDFTNSYGACLYGLYSSGFFHAALVIFGSGLEILLLFERSLYFSPSSFKNMKIIIKSKKFLFIFLIIACLIGVIFIFGADPSYLDVQLDEKTWHRVWYYGVTSFSLTIAGNVLFYFANITRDILPLILKITLNTFIVYSIKNYTRKLEMEKQAFAQKISFSSPIDQIHVNTNNRTHYGFISKAQRNQTYSAIIMSLFSLFEHTFYAMAYGMYFFNKVELYVFFVYAGLLSIVLKLIGNILILFIFNSLFRNEIKKCLKF